MVQPIDERLVRSARGFLRNCIRARSAKAAEAALDPIWDRVETSPRFADAAFVAIQRMRELGELYDDEASCLLVEIYEYRDNEYAEHDAEHQRLLEEFMADIGAGSAAKHPEPWHLERLGRRTDQLKAAFLRARGELLLAERVLAGDEALDIEIYEGEQSLVLDRRPYPVFEPVDPKWVALLRERFAALITAETWHETTEQQQRVWDVMREAAPASGIEAVRQLEAIGMITRDQAFYLIDQIVELVVDEAMLADRIGSRLLRLCDDAPHDIDVQEAFLARCMRFQLYYLRRFGQHDMAELLRRDPAEFQRIIDDAPPSEWASSLRAPNVEE